MRLLSTFLQVPLLIALGAGQTLASAAPPSFDTGGLHAAPRLTQADRAPVLDATLAGKRVVAVGDYGIVILSDDGKLFRQAKLVPSRTVLTSVFFLNAERGWAAGHDGTVLGSQDGGETWQVLREERGKERALMSVWFENAQHGLAVGQFGLVVETEDGGRTWRERRLVDDPEQGDKHLMHIVPGRGGHLYVAAEGGAIFHSEDHGHTWAVAQTDNKGSFWTGLVLHDDSIVVAGLRGHIYRSSDHGLHWQEVPSGTQQSLTAIWQAADGGLRLVGMSGAIVTSADQGKTFTARLRPDRANLTALGDGQSGPLLFSLNGVVAAK